MNVFAVDSTAVRSISTSEVQAILSSTKVGNITRKFIFYMVVQRRVLRVVRSLMILLSQIFPRVC